MRKSQRVASATAMVGMALIGALVTPTAASATPLTGSLSCQVASGTFDCSLTITGGTQPYTTTWSTRAYVHLTSTGTYSASGYCTLSKGGDVIADVHDAAGHTWSGQSFIDCNFM